MSTESVFHASLRLLLRPLARYCIRHAIRLQEVLEVLKQVFIEVGVESLTSEQKEVTIARLSVMTGVHRKDATRLFEQDQTAAPATGSLISRIVGQWQGDERFCGSAGRPKTLSFMGSDSEFEALVHTVSKELNASLVLSELERVGTVERTSKGVKLVSSTFEVGHDVEEALSLLAEDSSDLMECVEANVAPGAIEKNLHIKTEFDGIPDELLPEVCRHVLVEGTKFHRAISAYLASNDRDVNKAIRDLPGRNRVAVGSFSIAHVERSNVKRKKEM